MSKKKNLNANLDELKINLTRNGKNRTNRVKTWVTVKVTCALICLLSLTTSTAKKQSNKSHIKVSSICSSIYIFSLINNHLWFLFKLKFHFGEHRCKRPLSRTYFLSTFKKVYKQNILIRWSKHKMEIWNKFTHHLNHGMLAHLF